MASEEDKKGVRTPENEPGSAGPHSQPEEPSVSHAPTTDDSYGYYDDPYGYDNQAGTQVSEPEKTKALAPLPASGVAAPPPPPPPSSEDSDEADDDGMLRMSFMEHLEELRSRIFYCLAGIGVAFFVSIAFANQLWEIVSQPAITALTNLGYEDPRLAQITPMETFTTVWVKLPMLTAIFLSSPWVLYQVWSFIAPGLYRKERRWAAPFVIFSAGLFVLGGLFAYFVAFRFGLTFLLGIGRDIRILPLVSVTEYFNLFVNVILGISLVFELPVLIFFLTLLRIVTPRFLITNSRYAILLIVILAAIVTPTPDVINLMLFSVPMVLLYFVGIFGSYLLVLNREGRGFPWKLVLIGTLVLALLLAALGYVAVTKFGYQIGTTWPFLTR